MSIVLCWALLLAPVVTAFSFSAGPPTECDSLPVSWTGGNAPFSLHLIPEFGTPRNISIPATAFSNGQGSYSLPQLPMPQGRRFVVSMSDSVGFGTGGTTDLLTVGTSKGGKCITTNPDVDFSFQLNSALTQCRPYVFNGYPDAIQPVTIMGIIPSGNPFVLRPPAGATQFSWTANVEHGTSVIFMMVDALGRQGGSSDVRVVANSDDRSCLNGLSPSSTSALPATTPTSSRNPTDTAKPTTSATPSPSSSQPASSGGTSIGAIAGTVIGALLFLAVVITLALFFLKRRKDSQTGLSTSSGFPAYGGSHNSHPYSLSSTANPAYASTPGPYTPHSPQQSYGSQPYGHSYQPSAYAPSTRTHNHTVSGGPGQAYDGYQGSMLPYDSNPFLDNPPQQQYPPAHYQSTYQLPSASAYTLPNPADPFNSPLTSQGYPPPPPTIDDPFASSEILSRAESMTSSQQRKAAMAGVSTYNNPSRIVVHTDADDVLPPPNADGVVELPPQYTERRGLAVVNQSPPSPSPSQTQFPSSTLHQPPPPPPPPPGSS